jgi:hypothetical protein
MVTVVEGVPGTIAVSGTAVGLVDVRLTATVGGSDMEDDDPDTEPEDELEPEAEAGEEEGGGADDDDDDDDEDCARTARETSRAMRTECLAIVSWIQLETRLLYALRGYIIYSHRSALDNRTFSFTRAHFLAGLLKVNLLVRILFPLLLRVRNILVISPHKVVARIVKQVNDHIRQLCPSLAGATPQNFKHPPGPAPTDPQTS